MKSYYQYNVRDSMNFELKILQRVLTLVTGKPLKNQKQLQKSTVIEISLTLIFLCISTIVPALYFESLSAQTSLFALLPCWIVATGSLRKISVTYAHHSVHNCLLTTNTTINRILLFLFTVIPVVQNGKDYTFDHLGHHDNNHFTTDRDSDANFLIKLGFHSGMSVEYYKSQLLHTIFSPKFHVDFLYSRIKSCLFRDNLFESLFSSIWLVCIFIFTWKYPIGSVIFVVFPMTFLYQISALLQFLSEHAWLKTKEAPRDNEEYATRCWGRFTGETYPENEGAYQKLFWWVKMFFYHMPTRIAVICGDLPVHDWHHLAGKYRQSPTRWQESIYLREVVAQQGNNSISSNEVWGLHNMIMHSFYNLSKGEKNVYK